MTSYSSARSLTVVRVLPAPPETVFDAWLDPEAIRTWMCPGEIFESVATIEPHEGGAFEIVMRSPGVDDVHRGRYRVIDRPRRLVFSWHSASTDWLETVVQIDLRPHGDGECELTLTHDLLPPSQVEQHFVGWKAHLRCLLDQLRAGDSAG